MPAASTWLLQPGFHRFPASETAVGPGYQVGQTDSAPGAGHRHNSQNLRTPKVPARMQNVGNAIPVCTRFGLPRAGTTGYSSSSGLNRYRLCHGFWKKAWILIFITQ